VITDQKLIAAEYLKSWFMIDFLSIFPFDLLIMAFMGSSDGGEVVKANMLIRISKVSKIYRVLRLIRLIKIIKVMKKKENH
jgi:hypothetical protein